MVALKEKSEGTSAWKKSMSVQNVVQVYLVDVELIHWINLHLNVLVGQLRKSGDHQRHEDSSSGHQ